MIDAIRIPSRWILLLLPLFSPFAATTASTAPLEVATQNLSSLCLFSASCSLTIVTEGVDYLLTTGGRVLSRSLEPGEPGSTAEGLHLHSYRVDLANAVALGATECVSRIDVPFGKIERLDYDGDGDLDDAMVTDALTGSGNVTVASAELVDDTLRVTFAGSGVCQGAFSGDGDRSFALYAASRHPATIGPGTAGFVFSPDEALTTLAAPDVPVTPAMEDYAFAWANDPYAAFYSPPSLYSYNRTGEPITITRSGVGRYLVEFEGMETVWNWNGNAQVSTYGASFIDDVRCSLAGWTPNDVFVRCYDALGNEADATFTVLLAKPKPIRDGVAHVRADQANTAFYEPDPAYVHNPGGGSTTIARSSEGRYSVSFGGFGNSALDGPGLGGNIQVTPISSRRARCHVASWSYSAGVVNVACDDETGAPINANFSLLWTMPTERFDGDIAYAWSNAPATPSYEPSPLYATNPGSGGVRGSWSATGRYDVEFEGLASVSGPTGGHVQVTTYGAGSDECGVSIWTENTVSVRCFDASGSPTNGRFNVLRLQPTTPVPEPGLPLALAAGGLGLVGIGRQGWTGKRRRG